MNQGQTDVSIPDAELHLPAVLHNKYVDLSITLCLLMPLPHVNYVKPSVRRNHGFFAGPLLNYTIQILPYSQPPERVHPVQAVQDSSKVLLQALHVGILHLKAEKQVCLSMRELLFPPKKFLFGFWNNYLSDSLSCLLKVGELD